MSNGSSKIAKRPALGRGLSSLIGNAPGADAAPAPGRRILEVPIEQVEPRSDQPRRHFDDGALDELASSIRDKGVLSPLLVRRRPGGYVIIAGERRWRASQRAGLQQVPVVIEDADDDEAFELALIENIQRQDLSPIEEAEAYERLMKRHRWTQEQVAQRVGKDRSTVANSLRLLKLPEPARGAVVDGRVSMGHARALVALGDDALIEQALREVLAKGLSVRQTESLTRRMKQPPADTPEAPAPARLSPEARDLVDRLQRALGTRVTLQDRGGKGRILIEYGSLDELDGVLDRILGGK